ncbi:DNA polymerase I [Phormidium phage Pf-WMP3]|uniref:DNA polymerase n=2 Tax=Phormidium phage Pf-WMP3 TaxID=2914005 RepID=A5HL45_9CAUD|nr:DNA polymerase I [Phormidium phage Pf-WMP3]ABQ12452.2 DNA polymerase [Phormidium phage Pf-WMP3]
MNIFGHTVPVVLDIESDDLSAQYDVDTRVYLIGVQFLADYGLYAAGDYVYGSLEEMRDLCVSLANDTDVTFVIHNASFDVPALRLRGIPIKRYFCTQVAAHTWHPKSSEENSLDSLTGMKLDLRAELEVYRPDLKGKPKGYEYRLYDDKSHRGWSTVNDIFHSYLVSDLQATGKLYTTLEDNFSSDERALRCLLDINQPYVELIIEFEQGSWVDVDRVDEVQSKLQTLRDEAWSEITTHIRYDVTEIKRYKNGYKKRNGVVTYDHCPLVDFNPGSSDQVAAALTYLYGWEPTKLSDKTGKPSTSSEVLEELNYPLVSSLVKYQKMAKLMQFIPQIQANLDGNILRPSYNQSATRTTRLSSSKPNIQQIPSRDEHGKELRSLFSAPPGWSLVVGDQSGFQLRIMAAYMEMYYDEPRLSKVFVDGEDVHQFFADIYGIDRKIAKNVTFGYAFGAGATKMAATASRGGSVVPVSTIKGALSSLQDRLPALPALKTLVVEHARDNGGVFHDLLGQRYVVPELLSKNKSERAAGERRAFNYWVQGFEATAFRYLQLKARPVQFEYGAKLAFVVHDEVGYLCQSVVAEEFAKQMTSIYTTREVFPSDMTSGLTLEAEFQVGQTWLEAK